MEHLLKINKEFKNLWQTGDTNYIYKNELDKACFQHDMAYKDLEKRTQSDKFLKDKALKLQTNQNMMDIKED